MSSTKNNGREWYVIHASGYENKVKANLERRVQTMEKEDKIFRVVVPTDEETEIKDGRKKLVKRKRFQSPSSSRWSCQTTLGTW